MYAYMNKILYIDLTQKKYYFKELQQEIVELFIGGKGLGLKLLYDELPPKLDPFNEKNLLIFVSGPLTGTLAPSMRGCVISKSPLNNMFDDSYFGGHFIQEVKYAGYDAIVISGKSETPVFILIEDDNVKILEADYLWGLDTYETYDVLKGKLGKDVKIACIGPAGENLVKYALIDCDPHRQAGRGGLGAVMGSKKLKAIAVRGSKGIKIKEPKLFFEEVKKAHEFLKESTKPLAKYSTLINIPFSNEMGFFPVRNYSSGSFEKRSSINYDQHDKRVWLRDSACAACPIHCSKLGVIRRGAYKGSLCDNVEYETAGLLGGNIGISNVEDLNYLNLLCDKLGLDTISAGGVVGFTIEAYKNGLISKEDLGTDIDFGNTKAVAFLLNQIAYRKGIGNILAEGVLKASSIIGGGAEKLAVTIQGYEVPAWGPRGSEGMGLAYLTGDRGGCHQRAFPIAYEVEGVWQGQPVEDGKSINLKPEIVIWEQNLLAALYSLTICEIARGGITVNQYLDMFKYATGRDIDQDEFFRIGERIWNLARLFNIREGWKQNYSAMPSRFKEPLPDGKMKGHYFEENKLSQMMLRYNQLRGWDENGIPTNEKLKELRLI
ncbi:aldehyde ferredoxin oxidoreductase family protein [Thermoanaerobacter wiegelii]|uniref:Aldehyde ferredoxin oxidoreductase n=1 Tax=Thermoanaerobacter wiegelii Rt8.B1 TaxID=697303 RepID=G2MUW3_9THEO|nr:aldehyde ferredoxin oxidoreductase family protein [Thermoanaerobacter wiegelii]AEM77864.1 aldehyde ferredoxin oxidoreductase [Thermoanaerobacter wiegelii Rt8.B1]